MKRLLLIALLSTLLTDATYPAEGIEQARGIIGLLPLPEVFGDFPCDHFKSQDIEIYRTPNSATRIGRIYVSKPWRFPPTGGCAGLEVSVAISAPTQRVERLPTLEFSYESPGAIVTNRQGEWFEIALNEDYAWVRVQDADTRYLPVERLLKRSLAYLSGQGPLVMLNSPGQGKTIWSRSLSVKNKLPVKVLAFRHIEAQLWVRVRLLGVDPCSEESTDLTPITGWMAFHDAAGMPSIWFYSRGC